MKKTKRIMGFLLMVIMVVAYGAFALGSGETTETPQSEVQETEETVVTYEAADLSEMIEDLNANAMKAESKYQGKTIEFKGKIKSFDSDGSYISVEPTNADEWNFETAMCYIKTDEQKNFLIEKNVGDIITIRGKVKSIGEVLGYSIDIAEVE